MKLLIILLGIAFKTKSHEINVEHLQFIDVYNSSLADSFPVIYLCNFTVQYLNFSIVFRRQETKSTYLASLGLEQKFFNYESLKVSILKEITNEYTAHAVLFPNKDSFFNSNKKEINYETIMSIYKTIVNKTNQQKHTDLFLKIHLKRDSRKEKRNANEQDEYTAFKYPNQLIEPEKKLIKFKKESSKSKKAKLIVESCIHIHHDVFTEISNILSTTDLDYIRMYLLIYFSHLINTINKIYERIDSPLFTLGIEFVKLVLYTSDVPGLNIDLSLPLDRYIFKVNDYYAKQYENKSMDCDHIFLYHNYNEASIIGMALPSGICNKHHLTSLILFQFAARTELVIAHELLHNLGVGIHDNQHKSKKCNNSLMNTFLIDNNIGYIVSQCAIDQIASNFFLNNNLREQIYCLITENNQIKRQQLADFINKAEQIPPGYFYSLTDQCKFFLLDQNSFAFKFSAITCTDTISCYFGNHRQTSIRPLDGTRCDHNKVCRFSECIQDPNQINTKKFLQRSAALLRDKCPQGSIQHSLFNKHFKYNFNCQDLINNPNYEMSCRARFQHTNIEFNYTSICCETCLKASLNKCRAKDLNCRTTCSSFDQNPCYNGGKCKTNQTALHLSKAEVFFYCVCPAGYSGDLCLSFKPCDLEPCQEGELCYEYGELGHYYCMCNPSTIGYPFCNYLVKNSNSNGLLQISLKKSNKVIIRYYFNIVIMNLFLVSSVLIVYNIRIVNLVRI